MLAANSSNVKKMLDNFLADNVTGRSIFLTVLFAAKVVILFNLI